MPQVGTVLYTKFVDTLFEISKSLKTYLQVWVLKLLVSIGDEAQDGSQT